MKNTSRRLLQKIQQRLADDSYIEIYKRLRDGDLATVENAREFVNSIFSPERYDLSEIGRHHFNERFGLPIDAKATAQRTISVEDLVTITQEHH